MTKKMGELKKGEKGRITNVFFSDDNADIIRRLLEMGFLEGSDVEILHEAPFSLDPIAVRVRGAVLALRRSEANLVEVIHEGAGG
ncbi:FeoA family protein [Bdellovibrionota bacterium FG-2]